MEKKGKPTFSKKKINEGKNFYLVEVEKNDTNYYKAQEYLADIAVYQEKLR
ncbi:hypothetical protein ACFSO9_08705 [Mesonia maritima]|uniref:hypothetical protein n=1 Tax=Mesonia maritima TaxID=1793873 RepID=UPI00363828EB